MSLRKHVEKVWNIDPESTNYVPPTLYQYTGSSKYRNPIQQIVIRNETTAAGRVGGGGDGNGTGGYSGGMGGGYGGGNPSDRVIQGKDLILESVGTVPGAIVPEGYEHKSYCTCFAPKKNYPNYTLELA